jgi:hypothetical protein
VVKSKRFRECIDSVTSADGREDAKYQREKLNAQDETLDDRIEVLHAECTSRLRKEVVPKEVDSEYTEKTRFVLL